MNRIEHVNPHKHKRGDEVLLPNATSSSEGPQREGRPRTQAAKKEMRVFPAVTSSTHHSDLDTLLRAVCR